MSHGAPAGRSDCDIPDDATGADGIMQCPMPSHHHKSASDGGRGKQAVDLTLAIRCAFNKICLIEWPDLTGSAIGDLVSAWLLWEFT
jgi:hypothetical protein